MQPLKFIAVKYIETYPNPNFKPEEVGPVLLSTRAYNPRTGKLNRGEIKVYHGWGPTWMTLQKGSYTVLKDYGPVEYMKPQDFKGQFSQDFLKEADIEDLLDLSFTKEFRQIEPEPPKQSAGWISPEGKFYPCEYGEHLSLASLLARLHYNSFHGERLLEEKLWLKLTDEGHILPWEAKPNQRQLDTLADILQASDPASLFPEILQRSLERVATSV